MAQSPRRRERSLAAVWLAILSGSIAGLLPSARADESWVGSGAGIWSSGANWLDGSAPAMGGDPTLAVRFANLQGAPITADLDLGLFSLNRLSFDSKQPATV